MTIIIYNMILSVNSSGRERAAPVPRRFRFFSYFIIIIIHTYYVPPEISPILVRPIAEGDNRAFCI